MPDPQAKTGKRCSAITWLLAWGVHFYTALGLVAAAAMAVLIIRGGEGAFRGAFLLMVAATLIDATDGTLARRLHIKEVLPGFDGRRLDDLVDFLTYTCLPLLLIWRARLLPPGQEWWLLAPLLASAYGFCQVSAKTDDGYFLGFPSYWNLVAFYLYVLRLEGWCAVALLVGLALLTFVPMRYLYPSQRGRLNRLTNLLAVAWAALLVWVIFRLPAGGPGSDLAEELTRMVTLLEFAEPAASGPAIDEGTLRLTLISLFFPVYYLAASWLISLRLWRRRRGAKKVRAALP
jgi:phosphatidylcholine synthase